MYDIRVLLLNALTNEQMNERRKANSTAKGTTNTVCMSPNCSRVETIEYNMPQYQHTPFEYICVHFVFIRLVCDASLLVGLHTERTNRVLFSRMDCIECLGKKFYMAT